MSLLCATLSLVIGLHFLANNIYLSILISVSYFIFLGWRFGKQKLLTCLLLFGLGVAIPKIELKENQTIFSGFVVEAKDNYIVFESKLHKYYVKAQENEYEIGDYLVIEGNSEKFKYATFESQFNFKDYLHNKGIDKEIKTSSIDRKFASFIKINKFKGSFLSKFDENAATLISALLFNDKDYSSPLIKKADEIGLVYLFSLSGIYLNVLFEISNYILFLKVSRKKSQILTFIIFLPYAFFSFTKIGTLRVYSLYFLKYLNEFHFKKRKFTHIELVSILALIFIAIDYHLVYQEGFYIGFILSAISPTILNANKCLKKSGRRMHTLMLFMFLLLPLKITSGYFMPLMYLFEKLLVIINGFFIIFIPLSCLCISAVNLFANGELWLIDKMELINIKIPFGNWGGAFSYIYLAVFILIIFYLESVRLKDVKKMLCILSLILTVSIAPLQDPIINAVYFINVGQGDSTIIKNGSHTVMIDTGGYKSFDMAKESLIPFMNKHKINHIDALILTHDDFDHTGAKDSLIENFKVKNIITEKSQFPYSVGDLYIENLNTFSFNEDNDNSLILYTKFIGKKFLFMGDASTKVEDKIISTYNVDCDILKVGHHGSKSSTSEKFIKYVSPKEAVISVGEVNYYRHPNTEVIDLLEKYKIKIRRTDIEGTITYYRFQFI